MFVYEGSKCYETEQVNFKENIKRVFDRISVSSFSFQHLSRIHRILYKHFLFGISVTLHPAALFETYDSLQRLEKATSNIDLHRFNIVQVIREKKYIYYEEILPKRYPLVRFARDTNEHFDMNGKYESFVKCFPRLQNTTSKGHSRSLPSPISIKLCKFVQRSDTKVFFFLNRRNSNLKGETTLQSFRLSMLSLIFYHSANPRSFIKIQACTLHGRLFA